MPPEYPAELLWNGRQPDQTFDPDESLYYRVTGFDIQGKVDVAEIRCHDTSVNRGRFSRPEHSLFARLPKYLNHKVAQFQVQEIPPRLVTGEGRGIDFRIVHDPTIQPADPDENYAHSEIRAFDGIERKKNISQAVQKQYRMQLRRVMVPAPLPPQQD